MGLKVTKEAQPATPGGTTGHMWFDTTEGVLKFIDYTGQIYVLSSSSKNRYNLLDNSSFTYWQRQSPITYQTTITSATNRNYGMADRWAGTTQNGSVGARRIDATLATNTGLNARYYADIVKNTTGKMIISSAIPAQLSVPLAGTKVWVSFKAKLGFGTSWSSLRFGVFSYSGTADSSTPTAFLTAFNAGTTDATLGANYAYCVPYLTPLGGTADTQGVTVTVTSTWTKFGASFTVPTGAKNVVVGVWGSNQITANDLLFFAEPQLVAGEVPMDWAPDAEATEYRACARYYQKTFARDTAPAQNAGVNTNEFRWPANAAGAAAERSISYHWPMKMRTTPITTTLYNPAAANAQVRDITGAVDCTAGTLAGSTDSGFYITATGNAATAVGNTLGVHVTADAEIL